MFLLFIKAGYLPFAPQQYLAKCLNVISFYPKKNPEGLVSLKVNSEIPSETPTTCQLPISFYGTVKTRLMCGKLYGNHIIIYLLDRKADPKKPSRVDYSGKKNNKSVQKCHPNWIWNKNSFSLLGLILQYFTLEIFHFYMGIRFSIHRAMNIRWGSD